MGGEARHTDTGRAALAAVDAGRHRAGRQPRQLSGMFRFTVAEPVRVTTPPLTKIPPPPPAALPETRENGNIAMSAPGRPKTPPPRRVQRVPSHGSGVKRGDCAQLAADAPCGPHRVPVRGRGALHGERTLVHGEDPALPASPRSQTPTHCGQRHPAQCGRWSPGQRAAGDQPWTRWPTTQR
jgi:hypothetical protein